MKLKKLLQPICVGLLSAVIIAGSAGVSAENVGITAQNVPANDSSALFTKTVTADFSGLPNGAVDDNDDATVKYLKDRFTFYAFQHLAPWGFSADQPISTYFERPKVNGYVEKAQENNNSEDNWNTFLLPDTRGQLQGVIDGVNYDFQNGIIDHRGNYEHPERPTWTVDDEWLYCTAYQGDQAYLFRQCNIMYLHGDTLSTLANVEDFDLQMDFKFHPLTEGMKDGQDNLAVIFDAATAGSIAIEHQLMFAVAPDGQYFLGKCSNWTLPAYNGRFENVTFERDKKYHLSIQHIGRSIRIAITDAAGEKVAELYKDGLPVILSGVGGKLGITGSNMGAKYANIQVTPLNDNYSFSVTPNELVDWRFIDFSFPDGLKFNRMYLRGNEDLHWSTVDHGDIYNLRKEDVESDPFHKLDLGGTDRRENISSYLGTKFDVYHDNSMESDGVRTQHYVKEEKFNSQDLVPGYYGGMKLTSDGGQSVGLMMFMVDTANNGERKLLDQTMSLVPKKADGSAVQTENFETHFTTQLENDPEKAIAFSFRSNTPGMLIGDDGAAGYADKVTLLLSGKGWKLIDGTSMRISGNDFTKWTNGDNVIEDGVASFVDVHVRAVDNKLYIKVVENVTGIVLLETTEDITTEGSGYLYYSACRQMGKFYSIKCNLLDSRGNAYDWNSEPPVYTVEPGDANGDGNIDLLDLVRIKKYLADPDNVRIDNADYTGDGTVDSLDLAGVRKYLLGIR